MISWVYCIVTLLRFLRASFCLFLFAGRLDLVCFVLPFAAVWIL